MNDMVNSPSHYRSHPSGVECLEITEHMTFCIGNSLKYVYRRNDKWNTLEDLRKALFYLDRHIGKKVAPIWAHQHNWGRTKLHEVIDHEPNGNVWEFYNAIWWSKLDRARDALVQEIARLEAGDGGRSS